MLRERAEAARERERLEQGDQQAKKRIPIFLFQRRQWQRREKGALTASPPETLTLTPSHCRHQPYAPSCAAHTPSAPLLPHRSPSIRSPHSTHGRMPRPHPSSRGVGASGCERRSRRGRRSERRGRRKGGGRRCFRRCRIASARNASLDSLRSSSESSRCLP
jgi:hypothetical protein